MKRLNLGCGPDVRPGYENIDKFVSKDGVTVGDIKKLWHEDNSVIEILALDVLEHLPRFEWKGAVREWVRVLTPGGTLTICCPEMKELASGLLAATTDEEWEWLNRRIFGGQGEGVSDGHGMYHYTGFSYEYLRRYLEREHGLVYVTHEISNYNVTLTMRKL